MDLLEQLVLDWKKERPDLDASPMLIVGRILYLSKLLEGRISAILKPYGIHYSDLDVLATLRRSGDPYRLAPKDLMQSVLITSGSMTALLERLNKLHLIKRIPNPHDKRSLLAQLTVKGTNLIDKVIDLRFTEAAEAIEELKEKDKAELARLLAVMTEHLT